ncbi:MAG: aminoglycoside phosphotransferase family protein [Gemmatimonadetes bacterium]|nr:aminoglycoside phosphotransferase family protein [Gemmatimonadota bacterium]
MTGEGRMDAVTFEEELQEMVRVRGLAADSVHVLACRPGRRMTFLASEKSTQVSRVYKIMSRKHAARLAMILSHLAMASDIGWRIPKLIDWSDRWLEIEYLRGTPLFESLENLPSHAGPVGESLALLHDTNPPAAPLHDLDAERKVVLKAASRCREPGAALAARAAAALETLSAPEGADDRSDPVFLHRDFYDKQVLLDDVYPGLIDWDCAAIGPRCVDVGNFLAHVTLRRLQGRVSPANARLGRDAFLSGYESSARSLDAGDLAYFENLALLRLACVYAERPGEEQTASSLLAIARGAES